MDLFTVLGACVRRWYAVLPILLITGFFAFQAYQNVEPAYSAASSIVVLPSVAAPQVADGTDPATTTTEPAASNPYSASGGTRFAATVLARNINNTAAVRQALGMASTTEIFSATPSSTAPIVVINAQAASPDRVLELLDQVTAQSAVILEKFQADAGAPVSTRYRLAPAVPVAEVEDITPSPLRTVGAIIVIGLALAAIVAATLDSFLNRRKEQRQGQAEVAVPAEPVQSVAAGRTGRGPAYSSPGAGRTAGPYTAPAAVSRPADNRLRMGVHRAPNGRPAQDNGAADPAKNHPTAQY